VCVYIDIKKKKTFRSFLKRSTVHSYYYSHKCSSIKRERERERETLFVTGARCGKSSNRSIRCPIVCLCVFIVHSLPRLYSVSSPYSIDCQSQSMVGTFIKGEKKTKQNKENVYANVFFCWRQRYKLKAVSHGFLIQLLYFVFSPLRKKCFFYVRHHPLPSETMVVVESIRSVTFHYPCQHLCNIQNFHFNTNAFQSSYRLLLAIKMWNFVCQKQENVQQMLHQLCHPYSPEDDGDRTIYFYFWLLECLSSSFKGVIKLSCWAFAGRAFSWLCPIIK
jgi:hypothetical protein